MRWTVHGERILYDSYWMRLALADVEIPGIDRFEHHVLRMPAHAAGTIIHIAGRGVLLLWRHRFITDTWGWEIPGGRVDDGEASIAAAVRESVEESGWRPLGVRQLLTYHPIAGSSDATFDLFVADGAEHVGEPTDPGESERIEWRTIEQIRASMTVGEMTDGLSLTALLWWLTFDAR